MEVIYKHDKIKTNLKLLNKKIKKIDFYIQDKVSMSR